MQKSETERLSDRDSLTTMAEGTKEVVRSKVEMQEEREKLERQWAAFETEEEDLLERARLQEMRDRVASKEKRLQALREEVKKGEHSGKVHPDKKQLPDQASGVELGRLRGELRQSTAAAFAEVLNSSMSDTRASLRANNRALAQNLERLKLELRQERHGAMEMKSELQELQLKVNRLLRLVGLKDEKIEEEVNKRMKEQFSPLFDLVERAVVSLFNHGESLTELQDKCIEIKREFPIIGDQNSLPDRNSLSERYSSPDRNSLPTDTEADSPESTALANTLAHASRLPDTSGQPRGNLRAADGLSLMSTGAAAKSYHTDISMIAEQSILGDTSLLAEPEQAKEKKKSPETESSTVQKKKLKKKTSKMPQRVPFKAKYQPPDFSRPKTSSRSETAAKPPQPQPETTDPFKPSQTLHRSPMKRPAAEPVDPFKPTKTLLRSPINKTVMSNTFSEESPPEKIDSREFFASLAKESNNGILDEPMPCPVFEDEPTQFFNSDMELTSVIDMTKIAANSKSPNVPISVVEEAPESFNQSENLPVPPPVIKTVKNAIKSPRKKTVSKEKEVKQPQTDAANVKDADNAATVEVKNLKPGVFTYSVSRKEADGSRKPVPEKKSRARLKKKPKEVEKEEEPRRITEDRDMFNFGDRTPTVPLEKLQKPTSAVYDAMDESMIPPQTSLNSFRENMKDVHSDKPKEAASSVAAAAEKKSEPSKFYYLPLKGCSDDEPIEKPKSRGRSRSKKRNCSSDDDDWVPDRRPKSRSRGRKRISSEKDEAECKRSKSSTETAGPEQPIRRSARSKSRQRKSSVNEDEASVGSKAQILSDENKGEDSSAPNNKEESVRSCSRSKVRKDTTSSQRATSRSKSRPRESADSDNVTSPSKQSSFEKDPRQSPKCFEYKSEVSKRSARSRSRARQSKEDGQKQDRSERDGQSESEQSDKPTETRRSARSMSRARDLAESEDDMPSEKCTVEPDRTSRPADKATVSRRSARSRSRPRLVVDSEEEPTQKAQVESDETSVAAEKAIVKRSARSRPRARKIVVSDEDEEESSTKPTLEPERNSRPVDKATVRRSARSRSRPRPITPSDSEDEPTNKQSEETVSGKQASRRAESESTTTTPYKDNDISDHSGTASETLTTRKSPILSTEKADTLSCQTDKHSSRKSQTDTTTSHNKESVDHPGTSVDKSSDPDVYYLPLKGSPKDTEKPETSRARSRSRSRVKETDPDENLPRRSRSSRRSSRKSDTENSDAKFDELLKKVSMRSRSRRRRESSPDERSRQGGDTGLVLPDFILDCASPVSHPGDIVVPDTPQLASSSTTKQSHTTDKNTCVQSSTKTPTKETENCESQLSKSIKTVKGRSKSARKQKTDAKKNKTETAKDSPERDGIKTEEIETKTAVQSKSCKKKLDSERLSPSSENTGFVLPEFNLTYTVDNTEVKDSVSSRRTGKKVLTDRDSDMNADCEGDEVKPARKKSSGKKLSTKTPKIEDEDFKAPKMKSVKTKSTRKPKVTGEKSAGKKKSSSVLDTPKAEVENDTDYSAKASRKKLDEKFIQPDAPQDTTPRLESPSPASESKRSRKNRKVDSDSFGQNSREPVNDENAQPMSSLARLKQKLSMIGAGPRPSMVELDYHDNDDDESCQSAWVLPGSSKAKKETESMQDRIARQRAITTAFISEHCLPFTIAEDLLDLAKTLSEDKAALAKTTLSATSATYITTHGVARSLKEDLKAKLKDRMMSLNLDEATNNNNDKILNILVQFYDQDEKKVVLQHLGSRKQNLATAANILESIEEVLQEYSIEWSQVVSVLMDNCSTMRGVRGGVEALIRKKNPKLLDISGDTIHMVNNVAKTLMDCVDAGVQDFCLDLFYDIEESPKVKETFHDLQSLMNSKKAKHLIRPISSRFLQMLDVSTRVIDLLDYLTVYYYGFLEEEEKSKYGSLTSQIFKDHEVSEEAQAAVTLLQLGQEKQQKSGTSRDRKDRILSLLFLRRKELVVKINLQRGLLSVFLGYVKHFQSEKPTVHTLHDRMVSTTKEFLGMFIKPENIPEKANELVKLDVTDNDIQKKDKDLGVGRYAFADLAKARYDKSCQHCVTQLYSGLRQGYVAAAKKMLQLPINNKTLRMLSVLDPQAAGHEQAAVCFKKLARNLPQLLTEDEAGQLAMEADRYNVDQQVMDLVDTYVSSDTRDQRVDTDFWAKVFTMQTFNEPRYPMLERLVGAFISIFSGPLVESTFNIMDDIVEKDRARLSVKNYEAVAIIKTALRKKGTKATKMIVTPQMKHACITAFASYQNYLRDKKEEERRKKEERLIVSVQALKLEKAKKLAKLVRLKNKIMNKNKRKRNEANTSISSNTSGRKWKRIKFMRNFDWPNLQAYFLE